VQAPTTIPQGQLQVLINIIVAPQQAFIALRERPRWFVAFVIFSLLAVLGAVVSINATIHAIGIWYPAQVAADPRTASLPPDQIKSMTNIAVGVSRYTWVFAPVAILAFTALTGLILLGGSALFKGDAGFTRTFALAMNSGIIIGIGQLVQGLIVLARGPDSFASPLDLAAALPSLAWIAPGAPVKVSTLLAQFQPFAIWSYVVTSLGMVTVARVSRTAGFVAAAVPWVVGIGIAIVAAK
jgi:Yip1 domain